MNDELYTLSDIQTIAEKARPELKSFLNCNPINPIIKEQLEQNGFSVEKISGTFSTRRSHIGGESHMFLKVSPENIQEIHSPVIVDGAIQQFCTENYEEGRVFEEVGLKEDIPEVAILTKDNKLYEYYYEEEQF